MKKASILLRRELSKEIKEDIKSGKEDLFKFLVIFGIMIVSIVGFFGININGAIENFQSNLTDTATKSVREQFSDENVQHIARSTMESFVQFHTPQIINKKVETEMEPLKNELVSQIKQVKEQLDILNDFQNIKILESEALNGSRESYEKLVAMGSGEQKPYALISKNSMKNIQSDYIAFFYASISWTEQMPDESGRIIDYGRLPNSEILRLIEAAPTTIHQAKSKSTLIERRLGSLEARNEIRPLLIEHLKKAKKLEATIAYSYLLHYLDFYERQNELSNADLFDYNQFISP